MLVGVALFVVAALIPEPGPRSLPGLDPRVPWLLMGCVFFLVGVTGLFRLLWARLGYGMFDDLE